MTPSTSRSTASAVELDLATVEPSIAGPKRPQDRIPLAVAPHAVGSLLAGSLAVGRPGGRARRGVGRVVPRQRPDRDRSRPRITTSRPRRAAAASPTSWPSDPVPVSLDDGTDVSVDHGHVVIAAITSCTNTSNPSVMIGAGLLAKKAVERGLTRKPWVKTSLAPGSRVVTDYYDRAGLTPYLEQLGFGLVGYGCTTCIGNSGPLIPQVSRRRDRTRPDRLLGAVGQPQLRGPHPPRVQDELPDLPAAGDRLRADRHHARRPAPRPARHRLDGQPVYLRDIWPSTQEIEEVIDECVRAEMFTAATPTCSPATTTGAASTSRPGRSFVWDDDLHLCPPPAVLRRHEPRTGAGPRHHRSQSACRAG